MASSETSISVIVGSATVFLPRCQDRWKIARDQSAYQVEFVTSKSVVALENHGLKAKFTVLTITFDVYMDVFVAIEAKKEEAIWTGNAAYGWHGSVLPIAL